MDTVKIGKYIAGKRKALGMTQAQVAEKVGTSSPYVNRIIKKQDGVVNKTFVQMLEALGYDIELTYVKRDGNSEE